MPPPLPARDPWIGKTVAGRYHVEQKLGSGGMGTVYQATQEGLGRPVAVKLLKPEVAFDQATVTRFQREAKAMSRLEHPNTVKVFDFGRTEDGTLFFAMELLQGEVVTALLERHGVVPPVRVIDVGVQALASLHEAHSKGIVHRDLKPDNIYLARVEGHVEPVVKVLDFGIAKIFDGENQFDQLETQAGTVFGTPRYMSPEQAQGKSLDPRTDIYTIGVLLYQLLTGHPPFEDDDAIVVMAKHIKEKPTPILELVPEKPIPPSLAKVVMRALEKKPEARWQTAESFAQALNSCRHDALATQSGVTLATGAGAGSRLPLVAAALLLLAALGVGGFFLSADDAPEVETLPPVATAPEPTVADAVLESDPPGAEVWLGDELLGRTPLRYSLAREDRIDVEVRLDGYQPQPAQLVPDGLARYVQLEAALPDDELGLPPRETLGEPPRMRASSRMRSAMRTSTMAEAAVVMEAPMVTPMMSAYSRFD